MQPLQAHCFCGRATRKIVQVKPLMLSCNQLLAKYFAGSYKQPPWLLPWIDDNSKWLARELFCGTTYLHFCNLWFIKLRGNNYRFLWLKREQTEQRRLLSKEFVLRCCQQIFFYTPLLIYTEWKCALVSFLKFISLLLQTKSASKDLWTFITTKGRTADEI
jgi:hypothetical protein